MHSFGAIFADVAVDPDLGTIAVRRLIGAYAVGWIVNPLLARSQCIGGMVGGIGMALMEHTVVDRRDGRLTNGSLADYLVPVNAGIGEIDALLVDEG
jgi:xanthine dehydrogenase YagR molybdenum-binding subunit